MLRSTLILSALLGLVAACTTGAPQTKGTPGNGSGAAPLGLGLSPSRCVGDGECASRWTPRCDPKRKICVECVGEGDCPKRRICSRGRCALSCAAVSQCIFDLCNFSCKPAAGCRCDPRAVCEVGACPRAAALERCIRSKCPACFSQGFRGDSCSRCYNERCSAAFRACGDEC